MRPAILFVDEEPNVLNGLKRMLHSMHDEWDLSFCLSASQAMRIMESKHQDILVTDFLMPGMDGVQLLEQAHAKHPDVIRIVLSGHSDKELSLKAARHAHQFLPKPFQADELKDVLRRILALRAVFINPDVQAMLSRMDTLPSLPKAHREIMRELRSDSPSMQRVVDLISQDMGLSASIMKMVNSAFFGLRTKVSSLEHAVNLLGLDIISGLALNARLFSSFDQSAFPDFDLDNLWRHCLATGLFSKSIARSQGLGAQEQDELYICGILHDVGKLAMLAHGRPLYKQVVEQCREKNAAIWGVEKDVLGTSHAEIGAYLLALWGLDEQVVLGVHHHHDLRGVTGEAALNACILHAANSFDHAMTTINPGYGPHPLDMDSVAGLGYSEHIPAWRAACESAMEEVRANAAEDTRR